MTIAATLMNTLTSAHISYEVVDHPKSFSSAQTASVAHVPDDHIAKGVLVKDESGYVMVVIPASHWVSVKRLREELGRELRLAEEAEIERLFMDCVPGAVPPLGMVYGVETLLDEALTSLAHVYFEAGDHERLIKLDAGQFRSLMQGVRHGHFSDAT